MILTIDGEIYIFIVVGYEIAPFYSFNIATSSRPDCSLIVAYVCWSIFDFIKFILFDNWKEFICMVSSAACIAAILRFEIIGVRTIYIWKDNS